MHDVRVPGPAPVGQPARLQDAAVASEAAETAPYRLAIFSNDVGDAAFVRRARAFRDLGVDAVSFSFRRLGFANASFVPDWPNIDLGRGHVRRYWQRILASVPAVWRLLRAGSVLRRVDCFYARNVDMAVLAAFAHRVWRRRAPFVYESLDIQPVLSAASPRGRALRWLERRILARCDLLVVSSPGFVEGYFRPVQGYMGPFFLIENKVQVTPDLPDVPAESEETGVGPSAAPRDRWVIGWFGTFRCRESLEILAKVAEALPDRVSIYLRGHPPEVIWGPDGRDFREIVDRHPNMSYEGEFDSFTDLPAMFARIHFNWSVDLQAVGGNSTWLLPNRIYQGGYFNTPALAHAGSQTARKVRDDALGWVLEPPFAESVVALLQRLSWQDYAQFRIASSKQPKSRFCDYDDTQRLYERLRSLRASPP